MNKQACSEIPTLKLYTKPMICILTYACLNSWSCNSGKCLGCLEIPFKVQNPTFYKDGNKLHLDHKDAWGMVYKS